MIWKQYLWVAQWIFWIALPFAVFGSFVNRKSAKVGRDGRVEFLPSWLGKLGLLVIIAKFAFIGAGYLRHAAGHPWTAIAGVLSELAVLAFFFTLPGTVVVTGDGVEQLFWLRKDRRIRWEEIVEINSGVKDRMVTVTGANGTRIVHSRDLADRPRFLMELKQHCGENLPPDFPREPRTP